MSVSKKLSELGDLILHPGKAAKANPGATLEVPARVQAQLADEAAKLLAEKEAALARRLAEDAALKKAAAEATPKQTPVEEVLAAAADEGAGAGWGRYARGAAYGAGGAAGLGGAGYLAGMVNPLDAEDYRENPDVSAVSPAWKTALALGLLGGAGGAGLLRYSKDARVNDAFGQAIGGAVGAGAGVGAGAALGTGYGLGRRDDKARRSAYEDPFT
jgi:hypothetical protein